MSPRRMLVLAAALSAMPTGLPAADAPPATRTMQQVLDASKPSDWRALDPASTLYVDLPQGRVIIELAPAYAPLHVANIRTLARQHYWDGLAIVRVADNFVVQWADPAAAATPPGETRPLGHAQARLAPEFEREIAADLPFTRLPDGDVYAPEVGFSGGFPIARDPRAGTTWLAHCYGMVGAGRDDAPDSGPGTELYVVIGQAPRQLDRNIALVGRVVAGIERLSALPRGDGAMGFYTEPSQYTKILRVRLASDVPPAERARLEVLRTDTPTFAALVEARRNRRDAWYRHPAGRIDLCNVPLPVRPVPAQATGGKAKPGA